MATANCLQAWLGSCMCPYGEKACSALDLVKIEFGRGENLLSKDIKMCYNRMDINRVTHP